MTKSYGGVWESLLLDIRMSVVTGFYSMQQKFDMEKLAKKSVERLKAVVRR